MRAAVPEAAVYEDSQLHSRENDVCLPAQAAQRTGIDTVAQAESMQP
jgi:hypothetical protein